MQLSDAIALIDHPSLHTANKTTWADLGCGSGLFTQALSSLLAAGSTIHAIDKASVHQLPDEFNNVLIKTAQLDFIKSPLPVNALNGILMANSLHYVKDQPAFISKAEASLHKEGSFLMVEYDTDRSNTWVPYPLSFNSLKKLFHQAGYASVEKINERPSVYNSSRMYAALINR